MKKTFKKHPQKKQTTLISVAQYATMCGAGVSKNTIYKRIKLGEIQSSIIFVGGYPTTVIDIRKHPPEPEKPRGRQKYVVDLWLSLNSFYLTIKELRKYWNKK